MNAKETLTKARSMIDVPQKWMRGDYLNDKGRYSASGAVLRVLALEWAENDDEDFFKAFFYDHPAGNALRRALPIEFRRDDDARLDDFNDQATHAEVLALFDKAIDQVTR
jgi:hypothetical protein